MVRVELALRKECAVIEVEEDHDLERLRNEYEDLAADARKDLAEGKSDGEIRQRKSRQNDGDAKGSPT